MPKIPLDTSVEALYEDGFILSETEADDVTQFPHLIPKDESGGNLEGNNTFADILYKRPEVEHGKMVRFSVFYHNARYDLDWRLLPDNARPIRFRDRSSWIDENGDSGMTDWHGCRFGYQYTDKESRNHQEVTELP